MYFSIKQGLNEFGEAGLVSVKAELKQTIDKKFGNLSNLTH